MFNIVLDTANCFLCSPSSRSEPKAEIGLVYGMEARVSLALPFIGPSCTRLDCLTPPPQPLAGILVTGVHDYLPHPRYPANVLFIYA